MLDKLPMELVRRAARDDAALQELCELLKPAVQPVLAILSKAVWNPAILQKWFAAAVRSATQAPHLAEFRGDVLRGVAFASFMHGVGEAAVKLAATVHRSRPSDVATTGVSGAGGPGVPGGRAARDDVHGGDGLAIRTVGTMQPALIPVGV